MPRLRRRTEALYQFPVGPAIIGLPLSGASHIIAADVTSPDHLPLYTPPRLLVSLRSSILTGLLWKTLWTATN